MKNQSSVVNGLKMIAITMGSLAALILAATYVIFEILN